MGMFCTSKTTMQSSHLPQISDTVLVGTLQEVVPVIEPSNKHRGECVRHFRPHLRQPHSKKSPGDADSVLLQT